MVSGLVDQRVLEHPAHACRVRSEGRNHAVRELRLRGVQILEHARARPVQVGVVLEDDVDERQARSYQGVPVAITVEGANILTRTMIIFGQGAIRCHPYVVREIEAASNQDAQLGLEEFDDALFQHLLLVLLQIHR